MRWLEGFERGNHNHNITTLTMAPIYFGFRPRAGKATKQAVKTTSGEYEPTEPSRFKIFSNAIFNPVYSIIVNLLGVAVAIFAHNPGYYVQTTIEGLVTPSAGDNFLPFDSPGLAVIVSKGKALSQEVIKKLEDDNFTSMQMSGKTLWLKERATRDDYLFVKDIPDTDATGITPARYLSTESYRQFLILRSYTTRIAEFFHYLSGEQGTFALDKQKERSTHKGNAWHHATDTDQEDEPTASEPFEFENPKAFEPSVYEKVLESVFKTRGASNGLSVVNSAVLVSPFIARPAGILNVTDLGAGIKAHGLLFKFNHKLASPDINFIGDIIGRYFLKGLGDSVNDQFEMLAELKSGLSSLQLTKVGEEMTHFYKCIEIAIMSNAGCVPIFSGSRYEGSLVSGGFGATLTHNGESFPFQPAQSLKADFLNFSEHVSNLQAIMRLLQVSGDEDGEIVEITSMVELRKYCLDASLNQSQKDEILRRAAHLDFGIDHWVINPANLKSAFQLISDQSTYLSHETPIGRLSLFSEDPVMVALSCFGEKSAPSWDVPNGTPCSLKKGAPPIPPISPKKGTPSGGVSDAEWVMVIRTTDIVSAVEEFRSMADTLIYRSTASALAKKVGHRVFSRDRMNEFWIPMREALRAVNPDAVYEEERMDGSKRGREIEESKVTREGVKKRRMDV